ncbi:MAG TPA: hypothetical protein VNH44_13855 [Micropepsaceae bacterium]|nr:hypothetical protein [Micropepsaceae bacterium]
MAMFSKITAPLSASSLMNVSARHARRHINRGHGSRVRTVSPGAALFLEIAFKRTRFYRPVVSGI